MRSTTGRTCGGRRRSPVGLGAPDIRTQATIRLRPRTRNLRAHDNVSPTAGGYGKFHMTGRRQRSPPAFHRPHISTSRRRAIQETRPEMQAAHTHDEVIAMTGPRWPRRPRPGWAMTAMRRSIGTLRYANDELTRASKAMIRSARFPQRPQAGAPGSGTSTPAERTGTLSSLVQDVPAAERAARAA